MNDCSKNQVAWELLFDKYQIEDTVNDFGFFEITSTQINEFREARLMTKFDHKINLPAIFGKSNLSILPISRGNYLISHFDVYEKFKERKIDIVHASIPDYIESLDYETITSEAAAINCAFISGILSDFMEDDEILPTVSGRMSSGSFDYDIRNLKTKTDVNVRVSNSQIEIDGGFEGINSLMLLEAKNSLSDDFLVRQLYYPYRLWRNLVQKEVKPVFMTYANSIFSLYEYQFEEPEYYNSLVLVKQKNYSFEDTTITLQDIQNVFMCTKIIPEPEVPFPQADKFERVTNLCELLFSGGKSIDDVTSEYAFDPRQSEYYTSAGRYLGLITKVKYKSVSYSLTDKGKKIIGLHYKERQLKFVELILSHKVFNEVFKATMICGQIPSRREIIEIMKSCDLYHVQEDNTYNRRASTVISWINWILELQEY